MIDPGPDGDSFRLTGWVPIWEDGGQTLMDLVALVQSQSNDAASWRIIAAMLMAHLANDLQSVGGDPLDLSARWN